MSLAPLHQARKNSEACPQILRALIRACDGSGSDSDDLTPRNNGDGEEQTLKIANYHQQHHPHQGNRHNWTASSGGGGGDDETSITLTTEFEDGEFVDIDYTSEYSFDLSDDDEDENSEDIQTEIFLVNFLYTVDWIIFTGRHPLAATNLALSPSSSISLIDLPKKIIDECYIWREKFATKPTGPPNMIFNQRATLTKLDQLSMKANNLIRRSKDWQTSNLEVITDRKASIDHRNRIDPFPKLSAKNDNFVDSHLKKPMQSQEMELLHENPVLSSLTKNEKPIKAKKMNDYSRTVSKPIRKMHNRTPFVRGNDDKFILPPIIGNNYKRPQSNDFDSNFSRRSTLRQQQQLQQQQQQQSQQNTKNNNNFAQKFVSNFATNFNRQKSFDDANVHRNNGNNNENCDDDDEDEDEDDEENFDHRSDAPRKAWQSIETDVERQRRRFSLKSINQSSKMIAASNENRSKISLARITLDDLLNHSGAGPAWSNRSSAAAAAASHITLKLPNIEF